jgi:cytochrome oxidase Cu insertion factor (SCO1/SenC/PrrC family)
MGVIGGAILSAAVWVFIQDFGFFGGVGTDPNSIIPMVVVFVSGYVALVRAPAMAPATAPQIAGVPWRQRLSVDPAYTLRSVAALAAIGITVVGAAPMAFATANPNADPILTQAVDGPPTTTNIPAPAFDLVDQNGRQVTLTGLRGKALAVTFLDPVCTSDCPVIAQEFRSAARMLGADGQKVELIAIDANPRYTSRAYLTAFDEQEGLQDVSNWEYLTGSLPALQHVWSSFAVEVAYQSGGAMVDHSDVVYIVDPTGHTREVLNSDPGPATGATGSAFSQTLATGLKSALTPTG